MQWFIPDAASFDDRPTPFLLSFVAVWPEPKNEANMSWVQSAWMDMQRYLTGKLDPNLPSLGEDQSLAKHALSETAMPVCSR